MKRATRQVATLVSITVFSALAACKAPERMETLGRDFGNSVHHNMTMQLVDPSPVHEGRAVPYMQGVRAGGAIERYETGDVIAPEAIETTEFGD